MHASWQPCSIALAALLALVALRMLGRRVGAPCRIVLHDLGGDRARRASSDRVVHDAATMTTTSRVKRAGRSTFAFGGDVHFEGVLRALLAADPATVLAPIAPVLSAPTSRW